MKRIFVAAVLIVACTSAVAQSKAENPLMKADREFAKAFAANHVEGWMQYMADNAVMLEKTPVVGKEAIRKWAQEQYGNPKIKLEWTPTHAEIFKSDTMGYTSGRWTFTSAGDKGVLTKLSGNYFTVWQKQPDDSWKVVADGGTPDRMHPHRADAQPKPSH